MKFEDQHIIDYVTGKLDRNLVQQFESELAINESLKEACVAQRLVYDALLFQHGQELKKKLQAFDRDGATVDSVSNQKTESRFLVHRRWMVAATVLILAAATFLLIRKDPLENQIAHAYSETTISIARAGSDLVQSENYREAVKEFANNNFELAESYLFTITSVEPDYLAGQFLLIDVLVKRNQWHQAEKHIVELLPDQRINKQDSDRLTWNRALLQLKTVSKKEGMGAIRIIADNSNHLYRSKAQLFLSKK